MHFLQTTIFCLS